MDSVHSDTEQRGYIGVIFLRVVLYGFILKARVKRLWLCVRITYNLSHQAKCCACVRDESYFCR